MLPIDHAMLPVPSQTTKDAIMHETTLLTATMILNGREERERQRGGPFRRATKGRKGPVIKDVHTEGVVYWAPVNGSHVV